MSKMHLHADDAGLNFSANSAILELVSHQQLDSVSIIANSPHTRAFCQGLVKLLPTLNYSPRLYLHFNLIEFKALSSGVDTLTKGQPFRGKQTVIWTCLKRSLSKQAVTEELQAQFNQLRKYGVTIYGIDSHQHMHSLAPIAEAVDDFARQHSLHDVRSYNYMRCLTHTGKLKLWVWRLVCRASQLQLHRHWQLPTSWSKYAKSRPFVVASWEQLSDRTIPSRYLVVFHPGTDYDRSFKHTKDS